MPVEELYDVSYEKWGDISDGRIQFESGARMVYFNEIAPASKRTAPSDENVSHLRCFQLQARGGEIDRAVICPRRCALKNVNYAKILRLYISSTADESKSSD